MSIYGCQPGTNFFDRLAVAEFRPAAQPHEIKEGDRPICDRKQLRQLLPYVMHALQQSSQPEVHSLAYKIEIQAFMNDVLLDGNYVGIDGGEFVTRGFWGEEKIRAIETIQKICNERLTTPLQIGAKDRQRFLEFTIIQRRFLEKMAPDSIVVHYRVLKTKEIFENIMRELAFMFPSVEPASSCVVS